LNKRIAFFKNEYSFLSNFYPVTIEYEGIVYRSSEAAYQASKTHDIKIRKEFSKYSASKSKKEGENLVKDEIWWKHNSLRIMEEILRIKFSQEHLKNLLLSTGDEELNEGNTWHDNFFGSCICDNCQNIGQNHLGKILMKIRNDLRREISKNV